MCARAMSSQTHRTEATQVYQWTTSISLYALLPFTLQHFFFLCWSFPLPFFNGRARSLKRKCNGIPGTHCWQHPLPTTWTPTSHLLLQASNILKHGFRARDDGGAGAAGPAAPQSKGDPHDVPVYVRGGPTCKIAAESLGQQTSTILHHLTIHHALSMLTMLTTRTTRTTRTMLTMLYRIP